MCLKRFILTLKKKQEIWDTSRKVQCTLADKFSKYVTWSPVSVDMLDVVTGRPNSGRNDIDCWMDILQGIYPNVKLNSIKLSSNLMIYFVFKNDRLHR